MKTSPLAKGLEAAGRAMLPEGVAWSAYPGPQTMAMDSEADVLLYGGAAGGGKSFLLLGLAFTQHHRSLILRREFPQLMALEDEASELAYGRGRWNGTDHVWRMDDGRMVRFGSCPHADDWKKYQGQARDLLGIDEAANWLEETIRALMGWVRTTRKGQRSRVILASNPPTSDEGEYLIRMFAPWLDPDYPNPAEPGELRWCITTGDGDIWVEGPGDYKIDGETYTALSRTFVPARVEDNPALMESGYRDRLNALPEPLRSQMLHGDFLAGRKDDAFQVIPTSWIDAAMDRWEEPEGMVTDLGVDVARGGADFTTLAPIFGLHVGELIAYPATATPTGFEVAEYVHQLLQGLQPRIAVDVIGVGAAAFDAIRGRGYRAEPINVGEAAKLGKYALKDRSGSLAFTNLRAYGWWTLREMLDPKSGSMLILPPDRELRSELKAPRYQLRTGRIQIEGKDDIRKRLGRSTDRADAVILGVVRKRASVASLVA